MSATHLEIINPATEEIIASIQKDTDESVQQKLQQLKQGQSIWKNSSLDERLTIIKKYHELLERDIEILANTLTEEVGKPLQKARNEVNGSRSRIAWMMENVGKYLADETMSSSDNMSEIIKYEPLGVVCNISAWNYPYLVGTNVFIPALLAGNAVLYKPSEYATLTGQHIERLLNEAGVPADVFQLLSLIHI
jgi:acyl-CoA reductase-like NAD-dependent aldehyde dehydrogenase